MPPKTEPVKDEKDSQRKQSTQDDPFEIKGAKSKGIRGVSVDEQGGCRPGPSTETDFDKLRMELMGERLPPTKEEIAKSPVCRLASDSIVERSLADDPVVSEVKKLQEADEPFEKILVFHLGKRRFTEDQRKSWLSKINKLRRDRSLSSLPTEYETEASREVAHLKFSEEEISDFCEVLKKDDYWDVTAESKESLKNEELKTDTSSDSEIEMKDSEMKSPLQAISRSPKHMSTTKRPSWKEFKRGRNFESTYLKRQIEHSGVKKVIKKIVKAIWRKKKRQYIEERSEFCSIEVDKKEVQDFLFEAAGFMEKRYLGQIKAAACRIYPSGDDRFESECESGTYDSQDEWFPNNETLSSRINKMSVSVPTSTLQEYGLLDILIATLPMTLNYADPDETLEFVEILKMAKNRVPEHISIKNVPTVNKYGKEKPLGGYTVICTAHVEPPPDLERLERTGAKDYLKQLPTPEDEDSATSSISNGFKGQMKSEGSESSIKIDSTESSEDIKFIDESSSEEAEALLQPESGEQLKRDRSPTSPDTQSKNIPLEQ